jgi:PAS domain S-box-containing protein
MSSIETTASPFAGGGTGGTPPLSSDVAGLWLTTILGASREAIIGEDLSGCITSWNNAAEAMFGYAADEMIGRSVRTIIPSDLIDEEASIAGQLRRGEQTASFETSRRHKNGTVFPVSLSVSPIRDRQNSIIGVFKIARDLSEMQSVRRELEKSEARLRQAYKMEAIGRLAAGVAHDFNNILQSIVNALELVLDDVVEDTQAWKFTDMAIRAAVRGASLTDYVLAYAREQVLHPKLIELGPFLYDIQNLLGRTLGPHIAVTVHVDGSPVMFVDPGQLQTALLNLAINASHAMPRGGTLSMAAGEVIEDEEPWTVITITDTGQGMDEATLARAVEPFFTTKGIGGSGLGLSMVHGFAEQSGGRLNITSVPGRGTTVRLSRPSTVDSHDDVPRMVSGKPRSHCRILLVDDLTDVLLTLTALLARAGFEVTPADSGNQALAILAADGPFDLLITDFAMPGMNGADLITRCCVAQPGLRAVVITGFAEQSFADTLPRGTEVLRKPVQRRDLIESVHRLMRRDEAEADRTMERAE